MDAYLRPLVSCCLITTIIRLRKKDFGEIEKSMNRKILSNECICNCLYECA